MYFSAIHPFDECVSLNVCQLSVVRGPVPLPFHPGPTARSSPDLRFGPDCPLSCRRATRWLTAARPPPRAMPRPGPSSAPSWRCRAWRRSSGTAETSTLTIATFPRGLSAPPRKYQSRSVLHASLLCARCPSWRNAAGALVTATSECGEDGSWSPAEAAPPGQLLNPRTLPRQALDLFYVR